MLYFCPVRKDGVSHHRTVAECAMHCSVHHLSDSAAASALRSVLLACAVCPVNVLLMCSIRIVDSRRTCLSLFANHVTITDVLCH